MSIFYPVFLILNLTYLGGYLNKSNIALWAGKNKIKSNCSSTTVSSHFRSLYARSHTRSLYVRSRTHSTEKVPIIVQCDITPIYTHLVTVVLAPPWFYGVDVVEKHSAASSCTHYKGAIWTHAYPR